MHPRVTRGAPFYFPFLLSSLIGLGAAQAWFTRSRYLRFVVLVLGPPLLVLAVEVVRAQLDWMEPARFGPVFTAAAIPWLIGASLARPARWWWRRRQSGAGAPQPR